MRFHLKNRPKIDPKDFVDYCDAPFEFHSAVNKWFEGFERELRACYKWCNRPTKDCAECDVTAKRVIKEILGE